MDRTHHSPLDSGSRDGSGAGDHDQPYQFGRRPRAVAPWPFTERQYAHLLVLRGRVFDARFEDDRAEAHPIAFLEDGVWIASNGDLLSPPEQQRSAA